MEIKLSDDDFERLAVILERRISDRILGQFLNNSIYSEMTDRAKRFATDFIDQKMFNLNATEELRKELSALGCKKLEQIVKDAVSQINRDDPDLRKMVQQEMYAALKHRADQIAQRLYEDDYE